MNLSSLIVLLILVLIVGAVVFSLIRKQRRTGYLLVPAAVQAAV